MLMITSLIILFMNNKDVLAETLIQKLKEYNNTSTIPKYLFLSQPTTA